jgi:PadR family transcriptional regulator, regulatory protein PadR
MARRPPRPPRLSAVDSLILELLIANDEAMYGLQLVAASRRRLKRGTIYVTLGRMEEKGFVASRLEDAPAEAGGLPRRLYEPTALGRRVLAAWTAAAEHFSPRFAQ